MTQQINLADPRLLPQRVPFGATHALVGVVALVALGALGAWTLNLLAARATAETQRMRLQSTAPASAVAGKPSASPVRPDAAAIATEIERLRLLEAGQRRVRAALDAGAAGEREGPAGYFVALARQAQGSVWITGFGVSDDGSALELEGRMSAPHLLPDYLRRLNQEARFRGRPFAQLSLNAIDRSSGAVLPYTEFALRSAAAKAP